MPLKVVCPSCGRTGNAPDNALGRHAVCPACRTRYKITGSVLASEDFALAGEPPAAARPSAASTQRTDRSTARASKPSAPAEVEFPDLRRDPWPVRNDRDSEPEPARELWIYGAIAGAGVVGLALFSMIVWFVFMRGSAEKPAPGRSVDAPGPGRSDAVWITFAPSSDAGFSVSMPGKPKHQPRVDSLPGGKKLEHHVYVVEVGPCSYALNYIDFPGEVRPAQVAQIFNETRYEGARTRRSRVVEDRDIELNGYPGREWVEEIDGAGEGQILRMRVYIVGRRFYTLVATRPKNAKNAGDAEKFLTSFQVESGVPVARPDPRDNGPELTTPALAQPAQDRATQPLVKSAEGATVVDFQFVDADEDHVGTDGQEAGKPNGQKDLHFRVSLELPEGTTVDELIISSGGFHRWVTRPNERYWLLGVEQNGAPVIAAYRNTIGTFSGTQTFDLFAQGDLGPGTPFEFRAALTIAGKSVEIGGSCTRPRPVPKPGRVAEGSSSGGARLVSLQWVGNADDKIGTNGREAGQPNGEADQHLKIELELPGDTTIDNVVVIVPGSINHWESRPNDRFWPVAVFRGDEVVTASHVDRVGVFSGKQTFDLYVNGGFGLHAGAKFDVELTLTINGQDHTLKGTCEMP